jgi:hypothetical protein
MTENRTKWMVLLPNTKCPSATYPIGYGSLAYCTRLKTEEHPGLKRCSHVNCPIKG